eukprot:COSAG05_NODE_19019_length_299_cov_0.730000_1_plen_89_part_01
MQSAPKKPVCCCHITGIVNVEIARAWDVPPIIGDFAVEEVFCRVKIGDIIRHSVVSTELDANRAWLFGSDALLQFEAMATLRQIRVELV